MTVSNEPTVSELFKGIISDLQKAFANLTVDETKACAPAFISFFIRHQTFSLIESSISINRVLISVNCV